MLYLILYIEIQPDEKNLVTQKDGSKYSLNFLTDLLENLTLSLFPLEEMIKRIIFVGHR